MKAKYNITAFFVIGILGTLGHFMYEWSGESALAGVFFPVSESIWEHLKLLLYPVLIYSVFEYFTLKKRPVNYVSATAASVLAGNAAIVILYYAYSGALGYDIAGVDVMLFFVGIIVSLTVKNRIISKKIFTCLSANIIFAAAILIICILTGIWSFSPPSFAIFTPPV